MVGWTIRTDGGLVTQCLYKTTGRAKLSQKEFEELVLDHGTITRTGITCKRILL